MLPKSLQKTISILAICLAFPVIFLLLQYHYNIDRNVALQVRECCELEPIKPNYYFKKIRCDWHVLLVTMKTIWQWKDEKM